MVRNQLHLGEVCVCVLVARTTFKKGRSLFPGLILSRAGTRGRQDLRLWGPDKFFRLSHCISISLHLSGLYSLHNLDGILK